MSATESDTAAPGIILLVDDHEPTLQTLKRVLCDEGYEVLCALDGREACERLEAGSPHLVISDVRMPHVDGLTLCRLLRARPDTRTVPVVLCSVTRFSASERSFAALLGVNAVLTKPVSLPLLLDTVRATMSPAV